MGNLNRTLLASVLLFAGGAAQAGTLVKEQSLVAPDGLTRWFHYYAPSVMSASAPVIILLHGGTLSYNKVIDQTRSNVQITGFGNLDTTQWVDVAEEDGALLIIPNGVSPTGDDQGSNDTKGDTQIWNDCRNADEASAIETGADDVGFIARLIDWAQANFEVDSQRVYVTGHSNGGTMSFRVAAELGDRVAAIAPFIANLPVDPGHECAPPTHPIPVFMLNSTTDPVMAWEGGCDTTTGPRGCTLSAEATHEYWIAHNHITVEQSPVRYPNLDDRDAAAVGGSTVSSTLHTGGDEQTSVITYIVEGGGHNGPNIQYKLGPGSEATTGLQNHDIDGVRHAWKFLKTKKLTSADPEDPSGAQHIACKSTGTSPGPLHDAVVTKPASFDWQGEWQQDNQVCLPSRQSGAELRAYLVAPQNLDPLSDGSLPVVVIGPGSGGTAYATYYLWSARELAGHGYLALVVDPQGNGRSEASGDPTRCTAEGCPGVPAQQASNYMDGLLSGTDFVFARAHPWLQKADLTRVGLAGHSLSSRAANYIQGVDQRIQAVVAWDNLASTVEGDSGTPSGGGACGSVIGGELPSTTPVTPRVPTLGQASDAVGSCDPANSEANIKKAGYHHWRQAGVPSMEVVFSGAAHADWAQSRQSDVGQLQAFQCYTRGWFDLYLNRDETARDRLLSICSQTQTAAQESSTKFCSAAYMPEAGVDVEDLRPTTRCNLAPGAALAVAPASGYAPLPVTLDASGSSDPDAADSIASYTFEFGDGSAPVTQGGPTISHMYAAVGQYRASVKVTDNRGLQGAIPAQAEIAASAAPVPVSFDFRFVERKNVAPNTTVASETVNLGKFSGPLPIGIDSGGEYRIDDGPWTGAAGQIGSGARLRVRHVSADTLATAKVSTVTVGSYSTPFKTVTFSHGVGEN